MTGAAANAVPKRQSPARIALVTGGARRVGAAIVRALAVRGMRIAIHYSSSRDEANALLQELQANGTDAALFRADLRDPRAPDVLIHDVVAHFGALDVLVNSAAVMERTPFGSIDAAAWDAMFALNLRAPFFLAQAAFPALADRAGCIVNIADLAAFETWPEYIPHGITKAGIVQMTRALARTLAPRVRVNAVAPGAVLLPETWSQDDADRLAATTPLRRIGTAEDVAHAVQYLVDAAYVTGATIFVDGGRHVRT